MKLFTLSFLLSILFSSVASCDAENVEYSRLFVCTDSLKEPYGLCTHLSRKGVKYEFNTRSHEINMIGSVGANWIRTDFDRGRFINKHVNGRLDFTHFDKVLGTISTTEIKTLGIISKLTDMSGLSDWRKYVQQIAKRYKTVSHWEIINEADAKYEGNGLFVSDYVKLLKEGSLAVKANHKDSKVLLSGLSHATRSFLDSVLDSGGAAFFDIMNVHYYSNRRREPEELFDFYRLLSVKMSKYNVEKPVWLTETGCTSALNWATEET